MILSHRQRGSKSEIAKFKEVPVTKKLQTRVPIVTKKLQTRILIVKGVIVLRNDTVTKNVVVRCIRGTLWGPMRLRLGRRPRCHHRPRRIRVYQCGRRCSWVTPALTRSRSNPLCKSQLKLHESYVCSRHSTFVGVNEFHSFIVSSDYLLVTARNAQTKHGNKRIM